MRLEVRLAARGYLAAVYGISPTVAPEIIKQRVADLLNRGSFTFANPAEVGVCVAIL